MSSTAEFVKIGREAYAKGERRAPLANAEVYAAIENLTVGSGAADIMRAFCKGWDDANLSDAW